MSAGQGAGLEAGSSAGGNGRGGEQWSGWTYPQGRATRTEGELSMGIRERERERERESRKTQTSVARASRKEWRKLGKLSFLGPGRLEMLGWGIWGTCIRGGA
jgi:hypothetical protein